MSKMISLRIDVSKIDKSKLFKGGKGTYLDLTVALNDQADQFGRDVSVWVQQSKDERSANQPKNYLGGGKTIYDSNRQQPQNHNYQQQSTGYQQPQLPNSDDDFPF